MKTCNNCNTINEVTAIKCNTCNMYGDFTPLSNSVEEVPDVPTKNIQCTNCGSFHPGEGAHCQHCRFPMATSMPKLIPNKSIQLFRKVG
ncbi:MAG: hypothetical protein AAFZ15_00995 [Bacteroidota bacterium]